jgi:Domain of unknown function (DUF4126)
MENMANLALASGLSWASGLRLYATVFTLGLLAKFGYVSLPDSLKVLTHPIVLSVAGSLFIIEFLADKISIVDSLWDSVHTFIRIPAGALLAVGAINSSDPLMITLVGLLGGSLAGVTHLTKAGSRVLINTSPEPFTNTTASLSEEGLLLLGGWLAIVHPAIFLVFITVFIVALIWLLPKVWKGIQQVFGASK